MSKKHSFQFASGTCGFKKTKRPDLAVIFSTIPCSYSGVFTSNQIHAACVDENKSLLRKKSRVRAIIINSGNANACTGKKGIEAVKKTQKIAAELLGIKPHEILVASTGIIGHYLDMNKMETGLKSTVQKLNPSLQNFKEAAKAILTTDRFVKSAYKKTKDFMLCGFTKGAGMIHPKMATMLCFLMTDLKMPQSLLQYALKTVVEDTFNCISVDGDMSTNDMVILLSNNQSIGEVKTINDKLFLQFLDMLREVCIKFSKEIVLDGEGASRLITVGVKGAKKIEDAREIARSISTSTLFKCAMNGSDPNWGRAVSRIGCTGVKVNPSKMSVSLNNTIVYKDGEPLSFNKNKLYKEIKRGKEIFVTVDLKSGDKFAFAYGCDLSIDYVKFNSAYFT